MALSLSTFRSGNSWTNGERITWDSSSSTGSYHAYKKLIGNSYPNPARNRNRRNRRCNESLKHDHAAKAVFHAMKGAFRFISTGRKGIVSDGYDEQMVEEAAHIARNAAVAYLKAVGEPYVRDRSVKHYEENVLSKVSEPEGGNGFLWGGREPSDEEMDAYYAEVLEEGISMAWRKIDGENHVNGCRVAVAAAEHYFQEEVDV